MKKYMFGIIGIFIGLSLSLVITTHADVVKTVIGKVIQGEFPVKMNGKELDKKAIVIDGSSYLPVRSVGDALGLDISFNADLGIELKKKVDEVQMGHTLPPEGATPLDDQIKIKKNQKSENLLSIQNLKDGQQRRRVELDKLNNLPDAIKKATSSYDSEVSINQKAIEGYQKKIDSEQKEVDDINAFLLANDPTYSPSPTPSPSPVPVQ